MKILKKIRYWLGLFLIRRILKAQKRQKKVIAYHEAETFLVLFDADNSEGRKQVSDVLSAIREDGKQVRAVGYLGSVAKIPEQEVSTENMRYCKKKDFSFFLRPRTGWLRSLMEKEFDILMDLTAPGSQHMKYLAARSASKYKTGASHAEYIGIYDLILSVENHCPVKDLAHHMVYYLKIIKKA